MTLVGGKKTVEWFFISFVLMIELYAMRDIPIWFYASQRIGLLELRWG